VRREAAFSTWLFALATNLYCSECRRIPARTFSLDDGRGANGPPRTLDGSLERKNRERLVRCAVFTLPPKYREALLFYFHDMDVASTARSLALPEGTVKARLSRGREMLRRKLSQRLVPLQLSKEA
jgi:RNA polymerase sigma-70 factor, ECF subfamily